LQPPNDVYRVARKPDPWALLDWTWVHDDGTFYNRYDDPKAKYRVLYASTHRISCFIETLACHRVDMLAAAELANIAGEDDFYPRGKVPADYLSTRTMGIARVQAECADLCTSEWIAKLRVKLLPHATEFQLTDIDASVLQRSSPRQLTQLISRLVYDSGATGIRYLSKFGHDLENWALFEPVAILAKRTEALKADDPDLVKALEILKLSF
jgi:hypothetical protein